MESLEHFHQSRAVIEDFSTRTLAAIPSDFGRLAYICSLMEPSSGRYLHDGLMDLYAESAVQAALKHCHEELFSRILETPLKEQERDLCVCLDAAGGKFWDAAESWTQNDFVQKLCPQAAPDYLHNLFRSNLDALITILSSGRSN